MFSQMVISCHFSLAIPTSASTTPMTLKIPRRHETPQITIPRRTARRVSQLEARQRPDGPPLLPVGCFGQCCLTPLIRSLPFSTHHSSPGRLRLAQGFAARARGKLRWCQKHVRSRRVRSRRGGPLRRHSVLRTPRRSKKAGEGLFIESWQNMDSFMEPFWTFRTRACVLEHHVCRTFKNTGYS